MPLTDQQVYAIRKKRQRQESARIVEHDGRVGALVGIGFVDIVWSNDTGKAYHPTCRAFIPQGRLGTVDLSADPDDRGCQVCGHCGAPLKERTSA